MVCALCGIIIIILIAWEIMGPQVLITKQLIKDVSIYVFIFVTPSTGVSINISVNLTCTC